MHHFYGKLSTVRVQNSGGIMAQWIQHSSREWKVPDSKPSGDRVSCLESLDGLLTHGSCGVLV